MERRQSGQCPLAARAAVGDRRDDEGRRRRQRSVAVLSGGHLRGAGERRDVSFAGGRRVAPVRTRRARVRDGVLPRLEIDRGGRRRGNGSEGDGTGEGGGRMDRNGGGWW